MIGRPFDLTVSEQELSQAAIWWRSLSINQMKALEHKHFPNWSMAGSSRRAVHQMWEEAGKPTPESSDDDLIGLETIHVAWDGSEYVKTPVVWNGSAWVPTSSVNA